MITFDPVKLKARQAELEAAMNEPGFWDDQEQAQKTSTEHSRVSQAARDLRAALRASSRTPAGSTSSTRGWGTEIAESIVPLRAELERLEEAALFNGEYDAGDAVVTLQSGTGGTDAQDWTEMMLRMYERWGAGRGFKLELLDTSPGEEAGPEERDLHDRGRERLRDPQGRARQAPARAALAVRFARNRRQTSFATVIAAPLPARRRARSRSTRAT